VELEDMLKQYLILKHHSFSGSTIIVVVAAMKYSVKHILGQLANLSSDAINSCFHVCSISSNSFA
jgi:hypothetical protein